MVEVDPSIAIFPETLGKASHGERLKGRKILVVGGGQRDQADEDKSIGNGRAMSVLFAREGATVVVLDYNKRAADDTVAHIESEGGKAMPYEFDVRDKDNIPKAVDDAKSMMGGLDGMAIIVGTSRRIPLVETDAQAWDEDFAINVRSHFLFSKRGVEVMDPGGSIVIVSSMSALRALDNNPVYEAAKAALLGLTRAVARAGEDKAVRCNAICMVSDSSNINDTNVARMYRVQAVSSDQVSFSTKTETNIMRQGYVETPMGRASGKKVKSRASIVAFGRQATG